jgi:acetylcholinesterase
VARLHPGSRGGPAALLPDSSNIQISFAEPRPAVTIKHGTIIGRLVDDGWFPKPVEGFMGIPYALPSVNNLRFRPAVPVPEGNGTQEAFFLGPRYETKKIFFSLCCEYGFALIRSIRCSGKQLVPFLDDGVLGPDCESEDCLTINIWRPLGHSADKKKLPDGVLILGGAFNRGAARMHNTHPMLAHAPEPFIGVSMQYRVGVFGGLNTELTEKEGLLNLGLKDMYVALEWVQENIAEFGGDPDKVTVMGLSVAAHGVSSYYPTANLQSIDLNIP